MATERKDENIRLMVAQKTLELMTAAFALVAALAWNDAVQALFVRLFGTTDGILPKFIYAMIVTAIVVWVGVRLTRLTELVNKREK